MEIMTQLRKDVAFFRKQQLMDYSMLAFKMNHTSDYHREVERVYGKSSDTNL
jgi:hypothetical protein